MPAAAEPIRANLQPSCSILDKNNNTCSNQGNTVNGVNGFTSNKHRSTIVSKSVPWPPQQYGIYNELSDTLYSSSLIAKIWGVALCELDKETPPTRFPEYTEPKGTQYVTSDQSFWTSGFFPGNLYLLLERQRKWPRHFPENRPHPLKLQHACRWWSYNLHGQATRTDSHDLGFMIQPWAQRGWELDKDIDCYNSLITAAHALASRFEPRVGCIRSWDTCFTRRYAFDDPSKDFLVIIDNMMNLDLLYYVSRLTNNPKFAEIATAHALTTLKSHIRSDDSTCHVVNFEQKDGSIKARMTNQGYSDTSCWSRGQAWGIAGYAQAYRWTKDSRFLDASRRLADYLLSHLPEDNVPYWDFDAPLPGPKDTSAGLIAAYGLLLLHQTTGNSTDENPSEYLDAALKLIQGVIETSLAPKARFVKTSRGDEAVDVGTGPETIVLHATINNYEFAPRRWADHGLVYADYYFLLVGNELLKMGLIA